MVRNASHVTDYFRLPSRQVVEIGRQISIQGTIPHQTMCRCPMDMGKPRS
jgi:hypothetical protein